MNRDYIPIVLFFCAMGCIMTIIPTLGLISDDVSNQCKYIARNTSIPYHECYMDNVPFPLNVDTSNWHIWKVNKP